MREKFELCVKVVGLVLLCLGILVVLNAILLFFHNPLGSLYPSSTLSSNPAVRQIQNEMEVAMRNARIWTAVYVLLWGLAQVAIGTCLMRSNNLVVRRCYPRQDGRVQPGIASGPAGIDMAISEPPGQEQGTKNRPDKRYAPPGYFQ